jgi:hypothetical protein
LNLSGQDATDWDSYTVALRSVGISLNDEPDSLLWAGGDATGVISVKNIYTALLHPLDFGVDSTWLHRLWKWSIPLKCKFFIWLSAKEKVLTWEMLRKKGWEGPGICYFCNRSSEDIHHILIHCDFTKVVWQRLLMHFSLNLLWNGSTVSDCFNVWSTEKSAPVCLAVHACWQIWIERNKVLFDDRPPSLLAVVHRILASFSWQSVHY